VSEWWNVAALWWVFNGARDRLVWRSCGRCPGGHRGQSGRSVGCRGFVARCARRWWGGWLGQITSCRWRVNSKIIIEVWIMRYSGGGCRGCMGLTEVWTLYRGRTEWVGVVVVMQSFAWGWFDWVVWEGVFPPLVMGAIAINGGASSSGILMEEDEGGGRGSGFIVRNATI